MLFLYFTQMSTTIQKAFVLEALINCPAILALIFYPRATLSYALIAPLSTELNATTLFLARCAGVLILALTPQLLLAVPDDENCAGKRKTVYFTLGAGEAGLIPLLLWEAYRATDSEKLVGAGGFSRNAALLSAANLVPPLAWRFWVWGWRREWFGRQERKTLKGK